MDGDSGKIMMKETFITEKGLRLKWTIFHLENLEDERWEENKMVEK